MTIEAGAVFRFNSQGSAMTFIHRNGGEMLDVPKPKLKRKPNVDTANDSADSSAKPVTGDGGKGKAKAEAVAKRFDT